VISRINKYNFRKNLLLIIASIFSILFFANTVKSEVFYVSSQQEFEEAQDNAAFNDSILWISDTYYDIDLEIEKDRLFIAAEELGEVIFSGESKVEISADSITFQGFQFLQGDIGTEHVIDVTGSYILITQININAYDSYKYLRVKEESRYVTITYSNFENRLNLFDQNILSLLVDDTNPGYHKVQYCSFKNFEGTGNDMGIEPIRIGVSTQAEYISRSLVEYCYFTQCNGDGEIISNKARQNVFRYNTFDDNPKAELVLRHGSENIVYSNFFLNGKGGVRVREGQDQYIYNNYFYNLDDRAIYLQNEYDDPLDNINIAFNTIINCDDIRLGGDGGNYNPTNITFANNIFYRPGNDIFRNETGDEIWIGNIFFGDLDIPLPANGLTETDPLLEENSAGYYALSANSPAINAADSGYLLLPIFEGIENIDTSILLDLMQQSRPSLIGQKDLGCSEFSDSLVVQPFATEENTGPSYETSIVTSIEDKINENTDLIKITTNQSSDQLNISIYNSNASKIKIDIYNLNGKRLDSIFRESVQNGANYIRKDVAHLPSGLYILNAKYFDRLGKINKSQTLKFVK